MRDLALEILNCISQFNSNWEEESDLLWVSTPVTFAFLPLHEGNHGVAVLRQGFRQVWTVEANIHCTINGPGDQEGGIKLLGVTHCH